MPSITEFLEARIAEDEQAAHAAAAMMSGGVWGNDGTCVASGQDAFWVDGLHVDSPEIVAEHIVRHDPARVLAECDAKRAIIAECREDHEDSLTRNDDTVELGSAVLYALAAVYSDHPDYQEAWARG